MALDILKLCTQVEFLHDNQQKIADPENKEFIRKLAAALNSDETLVLNDSVIDKVDQLFEDAQK